jgi:hypothetical protein
MARPRLGLTWLSERVHMTVGGIIASLWMKLVRGWGLTEHDIDRLISDAIRKDKEKREKDPDYDAKVKNMNASTLRKEVRNKSTMTIKTLLKLLQYVVTVDEVEIYVRTTKKIPIFNGKEPQFVSEDEIINITELRKKGIEIGPNHITACVRIPSNIIIEDDDNDGNKE